MAARSGSSTPDADMRIVVLHGKDAFLRLERGRQLEAALQKSFGGLDRADLDGASASLSDVLDGLRTPGLFAPHKLVVLENADAQDVEVRDPLTIDGQEAVHSTAVFNLNGNEYRVEQYTLAVDGKGYVITFSHNKDLSEADRDAVDQSILASWSWA